MQKLRREGTVQVIAPRQDRFLCVESKMRELFEHALDDFFISIRVDAASAVNEYAARFQEWKNRACDRELFPLHAREVVQAQTPPNIDTPPHHARVGARRVEQDAIELLLA